MEEKGTRSHTSGLHWFLILLAASAARAALAWVFPPLVAADTSSYIDTAIQLTGGDYANYLGARVPVYPLTLWILGFSVAKVVFVQHLAGIAVALLLYEIFHRITGSRKLALAAGISQALNPFQIIIEQALLSEALTTLWVFLTVWLLIRALQGDRSRLCAAAAGLAAALAGLTHPLFVLLPFLAAAGLGLKSWLAGKRRQAVVLPALAVLPALLLFGGWCGFNYGRLHYFGLTTVIGINLINHTGAFIEDAPESYDQVKRIYLEYRGPQIARTGRQSSTIFFAMDDLKKATGLDYTGLNRLLTRLSISLILHSPFKYLRSAARSFARFWLPAWYTDQGGIRAVLRSASLPMKLMVGSFTMIHMGLSLLFVLFPLMYYFTEWVEKRLHFDFFSAGIYVLVFSVAVVQALANSGDNSRYELPVEPLVMAIGLIALLSIVKRKAIRRKT